MGAGDVVVPIDSARDEVEASPPNGKAADQYRKKVTIASDDAAGLTSQQAKEFHETWGYNEVSTKQTPEWVDIVKRYLDWVSLVIIAAAIVSVAVPNDGDRGWTSFTLLLIELQIIVWVGYFTDRNAGNAVKELERLSAPHTLVKRDGAWVELAVRELCLGDIIQLKGGDVIPADAKLIGNGEPLKIDESSLTGESLAVTRKPGDQVLAGAVVSQGELEAVVTAIGANTFFGKTMTLLGAPEEKGHLQKVLGRVSIVLGLIALAGVVAILIVMLTRNEGAGYSISTCFVIFVSVVPIGMPVVTAAVLAVGAREMVKEKAIVTRLSALEELSGLEILASDKTGTLTLNKLSLDMGEVQPWGNATAQEVLLKAALSAKWENGDAIDRAVSAAAGGNREAAIGQYNITRLIPFNPVDKKTVAYVTNPDGSKFITAKGAPQIIGELLTDAAARKATDEYIIERASRGLRALGVAESFDDGASWTLVGLIALLDPPRPDSAETIVKANNLGVEVKMVTGDQLAIAIETCRRLNMGTNIMEGKELMYAKDVDRGLAAKVLTVDGFAGVYPEHKYKIVEALQANGRLVGMTGDGVNDAPALKRANVGIAVADATDAAKGAADIILTEEGIGTIITAIVQSRMIFRRLETYIIYRMSSSLIILGFFFFATIILKLEFPTWTLVLLSLTNDLSVMATSFDKVYSSDTPSLWNMTACLAKAFAIAVVGVGGMVLLLLLADPDYLNWWHWYNVTLSQSTNGVTSPQTVAVMYLGMTGIIQLSILSTRNPSLWFHFSKKSAPPPAILLLIPVVAFLIGATFIAVYWPLDVQPDGGRASIEGAGWVPAVVTWMYTLVVFFLADVAKTIVSAVFIRHLHIKEHCKKTGERPPAWVRAIDAPGNASEAFADRCDEVLSKIWYGLSKPFRKGPKNIDRPLSQREIQVEMEARLSMRDMSGHIPADVLNNPELTAGPSLQRRTGVPAILEDGQLLEQADVHKPQNLIRYSVF